ERAARHDVLDPARAERAVGREAAAQLGTHLQQLIASRERIADAVTIRGENLRQPAGAEKITDVQPRGFAARRSHKGVQSKIAEDEIGPTIAVQVGGLDAVPPSARTRQASLVRAIDKGAVLLMEDVHRHPFPTTMRSSLPSPS